MLHGLSLREIARNNNVKLKTVVSHKYNAFRKLGIRSKLDLLQETSAAMWDMRPVRENNRFHHAMYEMLFSRTAEIKNRSLCCGCG
ncbi:LuxR C-terminal-related transcriptional regulator [Serratia rubidaea]|uniref:LuxR C-terminal-related transcriptional regulator n=1 Tax=Serratia rubidaea TaxID=61652 RepID=UPI0022B8C29E|nr:LuxR C-terminal-related transcriptional regulator [Serratia rubidaea]WBF46179.1 LuxR C-terminal-related transcriptional regulator [Serratia rubidaea]